VTIGYDFELGAHGLSLTLAELVTVFKRASSLTIVVFNSMIFFTEIRIVRKKLS
jgi:hypothetical protein